MKRLFLGITLLSAAFLASAQSPDSLQKKAKVLQDEKIEQYRRSSLYQILVQHPDADYAPTIDSVFLMVGTPDKFNNHDLETKAITSTAKKAKKVKENIRGTEKDPNLIDVNEFINSHAVARDMVAKWFGRDPVTGNFNIDLIVERGYYDASFDAIERADAEGRGRAMLADAGFELIGKTFLTANDITFIDHGENSGKAAGGIKQGFAIAGRLASAITGEDSFTELGDAAGTTIGTIANEFAGYKVNIITYLYRLNWNEDIENTFYSEYWIDENTGPEERERRKAAFENTNLFSLSYVGHTVTSAENLSSKTFSRKPLQEQFLKVCTRAIDKAIVELQREYDEFRVNVPIYAVNDDGTVEVKIGLKEGVNENSRYEVLMPDMSSGVTRYKKVGMLKPVPGKIWDNRFGALEEAEMLKADRAEAEASGSEEELAAVEAAEDADGEGDAYLTSTTFSIISGANAITTGLLIREETIKAENN